MPALSLPPVPTAVSYMFHRVLNTILLLLFIISKFFFTVKQTNIYRNKKRRWYYLIANRLETLREMPKLDLISWSGNFVERHNFRRVSGVSPELYGNCAFPQNVHTRKLGGISIFYAVKLSGQLILRAE